MEGSGAATESGLETKEHLGLLADHEGPPAAHRIVRANRGAELDRLVMLLPAGTAHEFVRRLPRRASREELFAYLEALTLLIQAEERGR